MKIMVVDDHPMVRKGIISTLSIEVDVHDIREASGVYEAMQLLSEFRPEIAIIDLRLGKEDGIEIVKRAKAMNYNTKFIILTSSIRRDDFRRAKEADVDGYILKDAFSEDITYAFHVIIRGKKYFDPEILRCESSQNADNDIGQLTQREMDILKLLGTGLSNDQIADKLFISENTVKKHISSVLQKLGLEHRTQAAIYVNNANRFDI